MYKGGRNSGIFEEEMRESKWQRVTRFSLGCSMRGRKYWEVKEEERKYRICERKKQTCKYMGRLCRLRRWKRMAKNGGSVRKKKRRGKMD